MKRNVSPVGQRRSSLSLTGGVPGLDATSSGLQSQHTGVTSGVHTEGKLLRAHLKLPRTEVRKAAEKTIKVKEKNYRTTRRAAEISWLHRSSRREDTLCLLGSKVQITYK